LLTGNVDTSLPFNLVLQGLPNLLGASGSGDLTVNAAATLDLDLGLDPSNPGQPFLVDSSAVTLEASVLGAPLNFDASLGLLTLSIQDGTVTLDQDGNAATNDVARFTVNINDDPVDHRYNLSELSTNIVNVGLTGQVDVTLPLFFQGAPVGGTITDANQDGVPDNQFRLHIGNLADPLNPTTTTIISPDLTALFSGTSLDLSLIIGGLDKLLETFENALRNEVFGSSLPLVGDDLQGAAQFIADLRTRLQTIANTGSADLVRQELFNILGPDPGLGWLADRTNDSDSQVTIDDISLQANQELVQFNFTLKRDLLALSVPIGFDIGLPALGLSVMQEDGQPAELLVKVGFDFDFGFGVSKTEGFFFDTSAAEELRIGVEVSMPDLELAGRLGFLTLAVKDSTEAPTSFTGTFAVNIQDPIGSNNRLTFTELNTGNVNAVDTVKATLSGKADVNLTLTAGFGDLQDQALFPTLSTDFSLDWQFGNATLGAGLLGDAPMVEFSDIRLNLGSFFSDFVAPIVEQMQEILGPIQPVLDILTVPLPVISDLAGEDFSLLDLAAELGYVDKGLVDAIEALADIARTISTIPTGVDNISISFGAFNLGNTDVRQAPDLTGVRPVTQQAQDVLTQLDNINTSSAAASKNFISQLRNAPGRGLQFPLLDNPATVFGLLLGKPQVLFTYDLPALRAAFTYTSPPFPIFPPFPVFARLSGTLGVKVDFAFGYDTTGLQAFTDSGDIADVFNGFFVSDRQNADGTGVDVPEVTLFGEIKVGAEINVAVAAAGVDGGIRATVNLNLNDPNDDGKVRLDEMRQNLELSPLCIFDAHGALTAFLGAYLKIGYETGIFGFITLFEARHEIVSPPLLDFSFSCPEIPGNPILATLLPDGTLRLNTGPHAGERLYGNTDDGDEAFTVRLDERDPANPTDDRILVSAFGDTEEFLPSEVTRIEADAGAGDDTITIRPGIHVPVFIIGGDGDDKLFTSDGPATVYGGAGNDTLVAGAGAVQFFGDDGDDRLLGSDGDDLLEGGAGHDYLKGGKSNDTLRGGSEDDLLLAGPGNDILEGGTGNDQLTGNEGDDILSGDAGNDVLLGNAGNDILFGGPGADIIRGDSGIDIIHGGTDADDISGGDENDFIFGDEGNDTIHSDRGDDYIEAGTGDDQVFGDAGYDLLVQSADVDMVLTDTSLSGQGLDTLNDIEAVSLIGGPGNNTFDVSGYTDVAMVDGGGGTDRVVSSNNADFTLSDWNLQRSTGGSFSLTSIEAASLTGGAGDNVFDVTRWTGVAMLAGGAGLDRVVSNNDADFVVSDTSLTRSSGGSFTLSGLEAATLTGGPGNNTLDASGFSGQVMLLGGEGNDTLRGGSGDDFLDGGLGTDFLTGGGGNDEILGGGTGDTLEGGPGDDILRGSDDGADLISSGAERDRLFGNAGNDTLQGGPDDDIIEGGPGDDTIASDGGSDLLLGGAGHDILYGHNASGSDDDLSVDYLYGDFGTNGNEAGSGRDQLFGQGGNDLLYGEGEDDLIQASSGVGVTEASGGLSNLVDFGSGEGPNPEDFVAPAPTPAPPLSPTTGIAMAPASLPTGVDYRGRWTEFASSATGAGLSGNAGLSIEPGIAAGVGGQYVVWADNRNGNFEIYLAQHGSAGWTQLGHSAQDGGISSTAGQSRRPSVALDAAGQPMVAWTEFTGTASDIRVARFDPTANGGLGGWVALDTSLGSCGISGTGAADQARIVNTVNGPVVAWLDSSGGGDQRLRQTVYRRRMGRAWCWQRQWHGRVGLGQQRS
jgi:Ca2+-binding RTX toxin-like protein